MTKAKPAPLSTANTPNDIDPETIARLAELDRTDPIDIAILSSDGSTQTFEGIGAEVHARTVENASRLWAGIANDPENHLEMPWPPVEEQIEETHVSNPYLLESSTVLNDLRYEAQRAQLLINAIDHEIEHLNTDADLQLRRIETRRKLEIDQRTARKDDLQRIVDAAALLDGKDQTNE